MNRSYHSFLVGLLLASLAGGCGRTEVAFPAGATVTPEVMAAGPWKSGTTAHFGTTLRLRAGEQTVPRLLKPEEIPADANVTGSVTFFAADRQLGDPVTVELRHPECGCITDRFAPTTVEGIAVPAAATSARVRVTVSVPSKNVDAVTEKRVEIESAN